jgi:hypothetical protein
MCNPPRLSIIRLSICPIISSSLPANLQRRFKLVTNLQVPGANPENTPLGLLKTLLSPSTISYIFSNISS